MNRFWLATVLLMAITLLTGAGCEDYTFSATSGPAGMHLVITGPEGSFGECQGYSRIFFGEALSTSPDAYPLCVWNDANWSDTQINIQVALVAPKTASAVTLRRPGMPDVVLGYFTRTGPYHWKTLYEFYNRQAKVVYALFRRGALEERDNGFDNPYYSALYDFVTEWSRACEYGWGECPSEEVTKDTVDALVAGGYFAVVDQLYYEYESLSMFCFFGEGTPECPDCYRSCLGDDPVGVASASLPGQMGIAAIGEPNPYADSAIALKLIAGAGVVASEKLFWTCPILSATAAAVGTGAYVTAIYIEDLMDMHGPEITLFPPDPDYGGIYTDQHVRFRVLLDDYPQIGSAASGIDYLNVRNSNPDPYVRVSVDPGGSLPGDSGEAPVSMYYTIDVWIIPGHSLPEGYEFWLYSKGYDKNGLASQQKGYKFWFEEQTDPPWWGSMSEYPNYIRENYYNESWKVSFGLTAPLGVDMIEFFVTGAGSYTHRWGNHDSLKLIGIDSLDDTFQTGTITIPQMGKQSWVSPGWYNVRMKLWDRAERQDEIYHSNVLYVMPQFTPAWSTWRFTEQGVSSTFIVTIYSTGYIAVDGCCATARGWRWVNQSRVSFLIFHDGCCEHFRDGSFSGDLNMAGDELTGTSSYGNWSALKLSDSMSSASAMSLCTEPHIIDKTGE